MWGSVADHSCDLFLPPPLDHITTNTITTVFSHKQQSSMPMYAQVLASQAPTAQAQAQAQPHPPLVQPQQAQQFLAFAASSQAVPLAAVPAPEGTVWPSSVLVGVQVTLKDSLAEELKSSLSDKSLDDSSRIGAEAGFAPWEEEGASDGSNLDLDGKDKLVIIQEDLSQDLVNVPIVDHAKACTPAWASPRRRSSPRTRRRRSRPPQPCPTSGCACRCSQSTRRKSKCNIHCSHG